MNSDKKINIAALALSSIARRSAIPAIQNSSFFNLTAIASRDQQKAREAAGQYQCRALGYEELLGADDVDAVYISLPVALHYEWAKKLLAAGKHLLVEKAFCRSYAEAEDLLKDAGDRKLVCMEALNYVNHPLFAGVQELLAAGAVGTVRHIDACFGFPHLGDTDIRYSKELGGGAALDALIYPLSLALKLNGPDYQDVRVKTFSEPGREVDTRGTIHIAWQDRTASVVYGFGFMYRNTYTIWGDSGYIVAERAFSRPPAFQNDILIHKQGEVEKQAVPAANHFELMFDDFAEAIRQGRADGMNQKSDILPRMRIISEAAGGGS